MDNERGTAQSTLFVDNKKDKTALLLPMCEWVASDCVDRVAFGEEMEGMGERANRRTTFV